MSTLPTRTLCAACGVEVDLDPREEPSAQTVRDLRRLLAEHQLIVFRGHPLTAEDHLRVASWFGALYDEHRGGPGYVSNARPDGIVRFGELLFHSDLAFAETPIAGVSLYGEDVSPGCTTTRFASGVRGLQALPASLRARVAGLRALHVYEMSEDLDFQNGAVRQREAGRPDADMRGEHPVIMNSQLTDLPVLYVTDMMTYGFSGMPKDASDRLLNELFAVLYAPENVYEHEWQPHDLVVWDNVALQHARGHVGRDDLPRTLRRVAIGDGSSPITKY